MIFCSSNPMLNAMDCSPNHGNLCGITGEGHHCLGAVQSLQHGKYFIKISTKYILTIQCLSLLLYIELVVRKRTYSPPLPCSDHQGISGKGLQVVGGSPGSSIWDYWSKKSIITTYTLRTISHPVWTPSC